MSHVTVARLALALVALLVAATLVFAWHQAGGTAPRSSREGGAPADQAGTGAEERPERLFARHCAACHELDDLAAELREAPHPAEALLEMLSFLEDHGATDGRQDRDLVELLLERSRAVR